MTYVPFFQWQSPKVYCNAIYLEPVHTIALINANPIKSINFIYDGAHDMILIEKSICSITICVDEKVIHVNNESIIHSSTGAELMITDEQSCLIKTAKNNCSFLLCVKNDLVPEISKVRAIAQFAKSETKIDATVSAPDVVVAKIDETITHLKERSIRLRELVSEQQKINQKIQEHTIEINKDIDNSIVFTDFLTAQAVEVERKHLKEMESVLKEHQQIQNKLAQIKLVVLGE